MSELPEPPRRLHPTALKGLRWGSGLLSTSLFGLLSVLLGVLWQSLLYGLGPVSYYRTHSDLMTVPATVSKVEMADLPSGRAQAAIAPIKVNDSLIEARGFGPRVAETKPGDKVVVLLPTGAAGEAYLQGYQRTPITISTLLKVASGFFLPCCVLLVIALVLTQRRIRLLREGRVGEAEQKRSFPLPRPFADKRLGQWKSEGKTFWAVIPKDLEQPTFLRSSRSRGFLETALVDWEIKDGELFADRLQTRLQVALNRGQVLGLILLLVAALLT